MRPQQLSDNQCTYPSPGGLAGQLTRSCAAQNPATLIGHEHSGISRGWRLITSPSWSHRHHWPSASVNSANAVMSESDVAETGCLIMCVSWLKTSR
jgi:hypothetical protein